MSTEEGEVEDSSQPPDDSVGARLVAARTATGLSVAEVAQRLHCGPDLIDALEANRFADLGAPVFSRGHLRRYSELLGLPIDTMLAQMAHQENANAPLPDLTQVPRAQSTPIDLRALRPLAAGVAAVALFASLVWLVLTQTRVDSETASVSGTTVTEIPDSDAAAALTTATPQIEPGVAATESAAIAARDPSPAAASTAATSPAAASTATTAPEASTAEGTSWPARSSVIAQRGGFSLALAVTEACWIEVYDKDNNILFYDMAQPGRRIQVSGPAPVRVRLGLANAVSLEFLGRRTPVPAELIRESLAHFTISSDGAFRRYLAAPVAESTTGPRPSGT